MQPIFAFSIGSMGTGLYFANLSRISERDRTPLPSPKASHESEIGKWTKREICGVPIPKIVVP